MGDMVRLLDGMLAPIPCASESFYQKCTCADEDHCGLRMLMIDVRNAVSNILDRYTLGDVVEVTLRKLRRDGLPIPFALIAEGDAEASLSVNWPFAKTRMCRNTTETIIPTRRSSSRSFSREISASKGSLYPIRSREMRALLPAEKMCWIFDRIE